MSSEDLLAVGRITRAHGVRGEVSVFVLTEVAERFEPGSTLLLAPTGERSLTVHSVRRHRQRLLVTFQEIRDRTEAERLQGAVLLAPPGSSPPDEGFWDHQIVGLEVVTEDGRSLGRIREVLHTPANDVWVAGEEPQVLVPALKDVVVQVDLESGRVVIRETPGLLEA